MISKIELLFLNLNLKFEDDLWFEDKIPDECKRDFSLSGKLVILGEILLMCGQSKEKL